MAKTRSQTGNIRIKKEEEDSKPALLLNGVNNTRRSGRIEKRKPPVTNNRRLPAQQVKVKEETDTKLLLQASSKYSKHGPRQKISQAQINQLIDYIANSNMDVPKASRKADISPTSGTYYYNVYKNDPEKKIPLPRNLAPRIFTQEQIGNLIRYIDTDKMTVKEASAKTNMPYRSGSYYYNKYLEDPNHAIPVQQLRQSYTQEQKSKFINYIVNGRLNIRQASKKAKMNLNGAKNYYRKYFKIQNPDIATPSHIVAYKCYTQEQINEVIGYIADDKMSKIAASRKANMHPSATERHYRRYVKDNNIKLPVTRRKYTQDNVNEFLRYMVDDKMSVHAASIKANMSNAAGYRRYYQYLKDRNIDRSIKKYTQDQINQLIGYIVDEKMTIKAASKKANLARSTCLRHYHQYINDKKRDTPTRCPRVVSARKNE
jgi:hypothetical protein